MYRGRGPHGPPGRGPPGRGPHGPPWNNLQPRGLHQGRWGGLEHHHRQDPSFQQPPKFTVPQEEISTKWHPNDVFFSFQQKVPSTQEAMSSIQRYLSNLTHTTSQHHSVLGFIFVSGYERGIIRVNSELTRQKLCPKANKYRTNLYDFPVHGQRLLFSRRTLKPKHVRSITRSILGESYDQLTNVQLNFYTQCVNDVYNGQISIIRSGSTNIDIESIEYFANEVTRKAPAEHLYESCSWECHNRRCIPVLCQDCKEESVHSACAESTRTTYSLLNLDEEGIQPHLCNACFVRAISRGPLSKRQRIERESNGDNINQIEGEDENGNNSNEETRVDDDDVSNESSGDDNNNNEDEDENGNNSNEETRVDDDNDNGSNEGSDGDNNNNEGGDEDETSGMNTKTLFWLGEVFNSGIMKGLIGKSRRNFIVHCLNCTDDDLDEFVDKYEPNIGGHLEDEFTYCEKPTEEQRGDFSHLLRLVSRDELCNFGDLEIEDSEEEGNGDDLVDTSSESDTNDEEITTILGKISAKQWQYYKDEGFRGEGLNMKARRLGRFGYGDPVPSDTNKTALIESIRETGGEKVVTVDSLFLNEGKQDHVAAFNIKFHVFEEYVKLHKKTIPQTVTAEHNTHIWWKSYLANLRKVSKKKEWTKPLDDATAMKLAAVLSLNEFLDKEE